MQLKSNLQHGFLDCFCFLPDFDFLFLNNLADCGFVILYHFFRCLPVLFHDFHGCLLHLDVNIFFTSSSSCFLNAYLYLVLATSSEIVSLSELPTIVDSIPPDSFILISAEIIIGYNITSNLILLRR